MADEKDNVTTMVVIDDEKELTDLQKDQVKAMIRTYFDMNMEVQVKNEQAFQDLQEIPPNQTIAHVVYAFVHAFALIYFMAKTSVNGSFLAATIIEMWEEYREEIEAAEREIANDD